MILLTGGTGCVGGHILADLVDRGETVRVLAHDAAPASLGPGIEVVRGDVCDSSRVDEAVRGCRAIIHVAGVAGLRVTDGRRMHQVNVLGTRNVARSARRYGARLVHLSSASAVGLVRDRLVDETCTDSLPRHPYPRSKRAGERAVLEEAARGLSAVILNPGAVLAPGGSAANTWSGLVEAVRRGRFRMAPPGGFGFVSRRSLIAAVQAGLAGAGGDSAERYLVVDENLRHRELIQAVADRVGAPPARGLAPAPLLAAVCAAGGLFVRNTSPSSSGLLHLDNLPFLTWQVAYDGSRARRVLAVPRTPIGEAIDELTAQETT